MAKTLADTISRLDFHLGDSSTDSITAAQRRIAISEATQEILTEFGLGLVDKTYTLDYFDTVNYYNITSDVPNLLDVVDLRRVEGEHLVQFTKKHSRELAIEINDLEGPSYGIERTGTNISLVIALAAQYGAKFLHTANTYDGNGTWAVDSTNSDATNITTDTVEFKQGNGSINFDIDVSQSGNNRATISVDDMSAVDLTTDEDLSSLLARVYIPDVTNFTSVTAYWGDSSTTYWSAVATTDILGNAFVAGWNRIKIDWEDTTKTGSPDKSATNYLRFDFNYGAGQGDDTDFRIDDIIMVRPEKLTLHYAGWIVGTDSGGDDITEFTATDDVPFYSGQYDHVDNFVAMRSASIIFDSMGQEVDAIIWGRRADKEKRKLMTALPDNRMATTKSFKVSGISWGRKVR